MKICLICNQSFISNSNIQKYCGSIKDFNTCSGKVQLLRQKLHSIKERCLNPKHKNYIKYSHIVIDKNWLNNSLSFVKWSLNNNWQKNLTIDRIDNEKGYFPDNCRWVTMSENYRNKKKNTTDWQNKTRICSNCKINKPFNMFVISRQEVGGHTYCCKVCRKSRNLTKKLNSN
jgi:hypothetical protein